MIVGSLNDTDVLLFSAATILAGSALLMLGKRLRGDS